MKVHLSGKLFVFPRQCVCCGAYPTTTLGVYGLERNKRAITRAWAWDIPYCMACRNHIQRYERAVLALLAGLLGALLVGVVMLAISRQATWALLIFNGLVALVALSAGLAFLGLRRLQRRNCIGMGRAISYLGSRGTCHSFDIRSRFYAAEFVRANHLKLVNLSPTVASIVRNLRHSEYQVPRRFIQRGKR